MTTIPIDTAGFRAALRSLRSYECPCVAALETYLDDPAIGGSDLIIGTLAALAADNARLRAELQRAIERVGVPVAMRVEVES